MVNRILAALTVTLAACVLGVQAQPKLPSAPVPAKTDKGETEIGDPSVIVGDAATRQDQLQRKYENFKQALLRLAQRLESSSKQEDRDKAKILKDAIKAAADKGIDAKFTALLISLRKEGTDKNIEQLKSVLDQNEQLRRDLQELIEMLLRDDPFARLKAERERTQRLLEELKELIAKQERVRAQTEIGRRTNEELRGAQNKVTRQTGDLIGEGKKGGKDGAPKDAASGKGAGKGKGEGKGEGKNDTGDAKGENKGREGEGKDPKGGDGKDGKGEGKPGDGKDGMAGDGKDGKGEGKPGDGKDGMAGEGKDGKSGEGKPGAGKDGMGEGKDGKAGEGKGEPKGGEGKPGEGKPGEGKAGEGKPMAGKPGEGKAGEGKDGKGEPKGGDSKGRSEGKGEGKDSKGKPSGMGGEGKDGKGDSKEGGKSGGKGSGQGKGGQGGQGGEGGQPPPGGEQDENPVKKQIQDANKYQKAAEDNLEKGKKDDATAKQTDALDELNKAKQKLEDLLRQLREEEIERLLAKLQERCQYMLQLQIEVRDGTVGLDKVVQANPEGKPTRAESQRSNELSDKEDEITREANAALRLLEAEGSAVAFAEVFKQVRDDTINVAARLRRTDTGEITVTIENDIIATLQEMIEALKKARQQNKDRKPPPPGQPQSGQPGDQKLIDLIAELKMIRSMQLRVNKRTKLYGDQYPGEQIPPVDTAKNAEEREKLDRLHREHNELAQRQEKIARVTDDLAKGKNENR